MSSSRPERTSVPPRIRTPGGLLLIGLSLVICTGGQLWASDRYNLDFAIPKDQPLRYENTITEAISYLDVDPGILPDLEDDGPTEGDIAALKGVIETRTVMDYRYAPLPEGNIQIRTKLIDSTVKMDGKEVQVSPHLTEGHQVISVKGYRMVPDKTAGDFDKFAVVLPLQPVRIGDSWTYTAPPTQDLPVFLTTTYTLEKIGKLKESRVAVIKGLTHVDQVDGPRSLRIRVDARAMIFFDLDEGHVAESRFKIRMFTEPVHGAGGRVLKSTATKNERIEVSR